MDKLFNSFVQTVEEQRKQIDELKDLEYWPS